MSAPSKVARVEQPAVNKPPTLTAGEISPEVFRAWEMCCRQFFMHKEVPENEMVKKVAWGMQEPIIQDWYLNDQDRFNSLSFADYIKEVRDYWLPSDWENTVRQNMLSSTQGQRSFIEWAVEIQSKNTLLRDTESYFTDVYLKYHLESHMNPTLRAEYRDECITETDLHKWIDKVKVLDRKRMRNVVQTKEAADSAYRAGQGKGSTDKKLASSTRFNAKSGQATSNSDSSKPFTRLPSLTDEERQLLRDNDGCFKCREPFVKHSSANCSKGFPDGATYKPITAATIAAKKAKKSAKDVVAAVEVEESHTVAVVMPSAVLGNGSDSDEECVAPLQTSHLRWECCVDGPAVSSPVVVSALIDHGSSLVLIDETLVNTLGLRRRQLQKPVPVTVALSEAKQSFLLSHYVKLSCSSLDQTYTSRTVRAVIAPNLCTPLLLGGPFLEHNRIIIDHELRTCVVKDTNYDLLQPRTAAAPPRKQIASFELKTIVESECEPVLGVNVVTAIQDRIKGLEYQNSLIALDAKFKLEFKDRFPCDIPHNDTMPSDVLFRVHLKEANKIVQQRSYDCPKKYRAAWK
ncbi:hypothetical protein CY34DRAFT_95004, partial [Suillus luteus UH-Slu-Lm8-n1]